MFQFESLGWRSFQQLCLSVSREILGQTVEGFLDSNDGGRDGAFAGTWCPQRGESLSGKFVIQCKFTSRPGYSLRPSDLNDEISKAERLVRENRCDAYVLMTNAGVSGETESKLQDMLSAVGVKSVLVLGVTWIEQQIRESKHLRMMVPRVYGLGDLSQILDQRAYAQAAAVLDSIRDDLSKVVVTESYRRAAKALDEHHFVLLVGEPAAGKTTIASLLAMASADRWGASVMKLNHPKSVEEHWNPLEKSQFFWIDDAFGVTQFESSLTMGWNRVLPQMKALLGQGSRIVMTSRDYIYNRARRELKEDAFPLFNESQVVIDVHDLTSDERRQILYNHLKMGSQPREFRIEIKEHLPSIADHKRFIPEIARRLSEPIFTKKLYISDWSLKNFVEKREQILVEVCKKLDVDSKAALALIYMRNGRLPSPIEPSVDEDKALKRLDSTLGACSSALEALRGSLVVHTVADGDSFWSFKHPTIGDAYSTILRSSPELLEIYVRGSDVEKLMEQVTCGDMQIQGAVALPTSLFDLLIERLSAYKTSPAYKDEYLSTWSAQRSLHAFLAQRCNKQFLERYLQSDPRLTATIASPSLYLEYSADVDLAIRLFKFRLLPEDDRQMFVKVVSAHACNGDDARALIDPDLRDMLKEKELARLRDAMRTQLLPRIDHVRLELESSYDPDDDNPDWHLRRFTQLLSAFEEEHPASWRIKRIVKRERLQAQAWIDRHRAKPVRSTARDITVNRSDEISDNGRSVFDDIDE
ncbi:hypothetical protein E2553_35250 [Paraburkholderia dipogonis]|uniref:Novel STAND NTPase 3 domain-containing protein n=1 Tax=Paraburkholderia dipogonis TaxID=1211383 RepID=A0A4Y8MWJ9_9BURK|nr:ATP-binding protein [Paraburkholderia dipogonis]TFE41897.1 hypothetical protein E2553_35250 [Paraburkholderia dipogonis]